MMVRDCNSISNVQNKTLRPVPNATPLVPNLTDVLSTAEERRLNQFGLAG